MKELKTLRKVTLNCSLHPGKELELYCEICMELICHNCTVKKHKDHQYDLVDEVFENKKDKLAKRGTRCKSPLRIKLIRSGRQSKVLMADQWRSISSWQPSRWK